MKIIKRVICVIAFLIIIFMMNSMVLKAVATVKVTTDTLNLRKKASTESDIVTLLSQGDTCELIEEDGDWYKVKYKNYTGYVSKEYVKKNGDSSQKADDKNDTSKKEDSSDKSDTVKKDDSTDKNDDNQPKSDTNTDSTGIKSTGKIASKTDVKIVPLIYSSKISQLTKNTSVTILTEINGWAYIETNTINGWVRSENISDKKVVSTPNKVPTTQDNQDTNKPTDNDQGTDNSVTSSTANDNQQTSTEKTMYVAESAINVRKEPNTSSKIMMELAINTKLTVIDESGEWYKVKTSEGNGYVLKKLLSDKKKTTSRGGNSLKHVSTTNEAEQTIINGQATTTTVTTQTKSDNTTTTNNTTTTKKVSTTKSTSSTTSSNTSKGKEVVEYAKKFLGVKYVYGGASKSGFDCSGFTMYVYKKFGISMRHGAQAQAKLGKSIKYNKKSASSIKKNLQAGDLVFFLDYETMDEIGHCGIYVGDGKFIHASSGSGYCVKINSLLPGDYYNKRFCGVRRVL